MAEITAAAVKQLRDETGLPMMECKKALQETGGDHAAAVDWLRKQGAKTQALRADRETTEGRIAVAAGVDPPVGAMVELLCESAPVAGSDDFMQLANDLARQLADAPGIDSPEALLAQPSPSKSGMTLAQQKDDLFNRIREVFNVKRIVRFDGPSAAYVHHDGKSGVLLEIKGTNADVARDIAMHIAAMKPQVLSRDQLDAQAVERERNILMEAARSEGKPENILEKMVEGRMRNYYAQQVLLDQPFVKDEKQTVEKVAKAAGIELVRFEYWKLG